MKLILCVKSKYHAHAAHPFGLYLQPVEGTSF